MPLLFIVRTVGEAPTAPDLQLKLVRDTPPIVRTVEQQLDYFCASDQACAERLAAAGWTVVSLEDGWYDDDAGGGVAVWGSGRFFEIRDTLFTVREVISPDRAIRPQADDSTQRTFNIRQTILGGA